MFRVPLDLLGGRLAHCDGVSRGEYKDILLMQGARRRSSISRRGPGKLELELELEL